MADDVQLARELVRREDNGTCDLYPCTRPATWRHALPGSKVPAFNACDSHRCPECEPLRTYDRTAVIVEEVAHG